MKAPGKRGEKLAAALSRLEAAPAEDIQTPAPVADTQPERSRTKQVTVHVSAADHKRLRDLSYFSGVSIQQLAIEGFSLMMEKRGHAPLEPTTSQNLNRKPRT